MKILIFGPKEPLGGVEAVVLAYATQLIANGCECDFLLYESYPLLEEKIAAIGGKVIYAASRRKNYSQYKKDIKAIFSTKYDAVWCNYSGLTNIDLLKLAKAANIPTRIAHSHTAGLSWGSPLMRILVPIMHYKNKLVIGKYATDLWACSKKAGQFMYPKKLWNGIKVWNNAIDLQAFYPNDKKRTQLRESLGLSNNLVIGHVGRICREKNQRFLLSVYKDFLSQTPNAHLLFLSDAPNNEIVSFANELGINDKITFLTGQHDLPTLYNSMDVFFLPSIVEGLGLTAIEAQSCGVPCVVSNGVSNEVNVSGCVSFLSLEETSSTWCAALNEAAKKRIPNPTDAIISHNYDIKNEGEKMYNFFKDRK